MSYNPSVFYHPTQGKRVVTSQDEQDALGPGWFDSPGKAVAPAGEPAAPVDEPAPAPKPSSRRRAQTFAKE
jgi:hypothetical protein